MKSTPKLELNALADKVFLREIRRKAKLDAVRGLNFNAIDALAANETERIKLTQDAALLSEMRHICLIITDCTEIMPEWTAFLEKAEYEARFWYGQSLGLLVREMFFALIGIREFSDLLIEKAIMTGEQLTRLKRAKKRLRKYM